MIDLKKLPSLIQRIPTQKNYPKHIIFEMFPSKSEFEQALRLTHELIEFQIENNIPVLTLNLGEHSVIKSEEMINFVEQLQRIGDEHKIRITIFGKWYGLMGELVEALKKLNIKTSEYDNHFLNLCINYDGKQEICDASRVIVKKIISGDKSIQITPDVLKENIYSSYFIPPELIVIRDNTFKGTFLWDTPNSHIISLNKKISETTKQDFTKILEEFSKKRQALENTET